VDSFYGSGRLDLSSLGDLTNDGVPEILVTRKTSHTVANLYIYDGAGNLLPSLGRATAMAVARDGSMFVDAVLPAGPDGHGKVLLALTSNYDANPRGTALFDQTSGSQLWYYAAGNSVNGSIADVDGDGKLDIVSATWTAVSNGTTGCGLGWNTCTNDWQTWVVLVDQDGHEKFAASFDSGGSISSRIVDLDRDGTKEILVVQAHWTQAWHTGESWIRLLNAEGSILRQLDGSQDLAWGVSAIADLDLDGKDEVILAETYNDINPKLRVVDSELNLVAEAPGYNFAEAINDINGDSWPEIIASSYATQRLGVLQLQEGTLVELWHTSPFSSPPGAIVSDLTGDGINEIIVTDDDGVHVLGYQPAPPPPTITVTPPPSQPRHTLIVANPGRMANLYGASITTQLMDRLADLAAHPRVNGTIVRLDEEPAVAAAYQAWDQHSPATDPTHTNEYANAVAEAIREVIRARFDQDPDLWYILLVGDDRIIPYRRLDDRSPFGEHTYRHVAVTTTVGAAMAQDKILTDDFYGDIIPDPAPGHPFYIPDRPVGRLVETPEGIMAAIDAFLAQDSTLASSALVTGYDLVTDLAWDEVGLFHADGVATTRLIGSYWDGQDLYTRLLGSGAGYELAGVNVHSTHFAYGAPAGGRVTASDVTGAWADLRGRVVFGPGCQAGLNVPPMGAPYPAADFPETFLARGANYIGNTGWGIGDWSAVAFSERLAAGLTAYLVGGPSATLGDAWLAAKLDYYVNEGVFDPVHEKVMAQFTLYGFPMYEVRSGGGGQASVEPGAEGQPGLLAGIARPSILEAIQAVKARAVQEPTKSASQPPRLTRVSVHYAPPGKGATQALVEHSEPQGTYYSLDGQVQRNHNRPLQPKQGWSLELSGGNAHGVVFRGGIYEDMAPFDPLVASAAVITGTTAGEGVFSGASWSPAIPYALKVVPLASDTHVQNLVVSFGQYHPEGIERLYRSMSFDIYYSDSSDYTPPTATVSSWLLDDKIQLAVNATDASGIHRVVATFTASDRHWRSVDLIWDPTAQRWRGEIPASSSVEYFVQVIDNAGNVFVDDNDGAYYHLPTPATCPDFAGPAGVGVEDIQAAAARWGLTAANPDPDNDLTTPNYETQYDLVFDGSIDIVDVMTVAAHWGDVCG
jgi:hypothetical protein